MFRWLPLQCLFNSLTLTEVSHSGHMIRRGSGSMIVIVLKTGALYNRQIDRAIAARWVQLSPRISRVPSTRDMQ